MSTLGNTERKSSEDEIRGSLSLENSNRIDHKSSKHLDFLFRRNLIDFFSVRRFWNERKMAKFLPLEFCERFRLQAYKSTANKRELARERERKVRVLRCMFQNEPIKNQTRRSKVFRVVRQEGRTKMKLQSEQIRSEFIVRSLLLDRNATDW